MDPAKLNQKDALPPYTLFSPTCRQPGIDLADTLNSLRHEGLSKHSSTHFVVIGTSRMRAVFNDLAQAVGLKGASKPRDYKNYFIEKKPVTVSQVFAKLKRRDSLIIDHTHRLIKRIFRFFAKHQLCGDKNRVVLIVSFGAWEVSSILFRETREYFEVHADVSFTHIL